MKVLGIECATPIQSAAVVDGDVVLAEASYHADGTRSRPLLSTIDAVLKKAGMAPHELELIAVSVGPGSFTGVRVGLATAKGLRLGTGAALVGVSTLETLAEGYDVGDCTICALLDAGRGEVYAAVFHRHGHGLERSTADAVYDFDALLTLLSVQNQAHVIGNGAFRYRDALKAAMGDRVMFSEKGLQAVPSAAMVARLGLAYKGKVTAAASDPGPVYLRRAEAEVKWEKGPVKSPLHKVIP
ncbi:MAG: tRNA (adenosine(37)-N6)-threonylcarbamoyltransferase complex dimerization subunit type 1 TsaB [Nitrospirae bacterium]|nr:MAG: tRNA (adenosine(37)-N6)-threonylcarbamoyltransferase complex dimerization subunit type 1 TsaB [Nitrospirota bacterium]